MKFKECSTGTRATKIKLEEKNVKAIFLNDKKIRHTKTKFDGCVLSNATAADFVLEKFSVGQIIVELKGKGVEHAAEQIIATARYLSENGLRSGNLGGLIVGRRWPRFDTALQRAQARFSAEFKSPMQLETYADGLSFERYVSFPNNNKK